MSHSGKFSRAQTSTMWCSLNRMANPTATNTRPVTGRLAVGGCPDPVEVYFLTGRTPDGKCTLHAKGGIAGKIIEGVKGLINDE